MSFTDPMAYIEEGKNSLFSDTFFDQSLKEFILLTKHHKGVYKNGLDIYDSFLCNFIDEGKEDRTTRKDVVLPLLLSEQLIQNKILGTPEEIIIDAAYFFAMYCSLKKLAAVSGYVKKASDSYYTFDIGKIISLKKKYPSKEEYLSPYEVRNIKRIDNDSIGDFYKKILSILTIEDSKTIKKLDKTKYNSLFSLFNPMIAVNGPVDNYYSQLTHYNSLKTELEFLKNRNYNNFYESYQKTIHDYIDEIAKKFLKLIKKEFLNPLYIMIAVGNGSGTSGIFNYSSLGCILFSYNLSKKEHNGTSEIQTIFSCDFKASITRLLHINAIGFDHGKDFKIEITVGNNTLIFNGEKGYEHGIKPKIMTKTEELYTNIESDSEVYDIVKWYRTATNTLVASFSQDNNTLRFFDVYEEPLSIDCYSSSDEVLLFISSIEKEQFYKRIIIQGLFEEDKFEIKKGDYALIFNDEEFFSTMASLLKSDQTSITATLEGRYIGCLNEDGEVEASLSFIPDKDTKHVEYDKPIENDSLLQFSNVEIVINKHNINIKIWSTTSPVWSRLDEHISPQNINEKRNVIEGSVLDQLNQYTNDYRIEIGANGEKIPSYNQPLAMLRSLGVLEAIAKKICSIDNTNSMKLKMETLLNNTFSVDASADVRKDKNTNYQLAPEKKISYAEYKNFKWYFKDDDKPENEKDYNQYDHSINFNEN